MQNVHAMRPGARAAYERALARVVEPVLAGRDGARADAFRTRLERHFADFYEPLAELYGERMQLDDLLRALLAADAERPDELRILDHEREITPDWLHREQTVGYVAYADRFAGTLRGVREKLPYLRELGVSYLHLMPLLRAREGPADGGYAVADYRSVNRALGTMDDLRALSRSLRELGMSLCVDLVLNHTAREHPWARAAIAGDRERLAFYRTFPDRELPDAYERTLPEVFPQIAPGNFTWVEELGRWVWTTFNTYQWDLDYANPAVFRAMAETMLFLANQGVDALRLDAVPFLWKRLGTNCQNQPEVHHLLQAFRALARVVAPAVAFKAEAIVAPADLVAYLGTGRHEGRECDLAYHNSLMVLLWSSLATGKVDLMTHVLRSMPRVPRNAGWMTYVRCHDDIGWAVTDEDAAAVGLSGFLHRRFLVDWYAGRFPGSSARGVAFQENAATGDARTSGMAASLAGLDAGDPWAVERILLLYSVIFSYGGVPLIYMGDELGLRNDPDWEADPAHAGDNRWMHRPAMDWAAAERRARPDSLEGRLWAGTRTLVRERRRRPAIHAGGEVEPFWTGNPHVFGYLRRHDGDELLAFCNFAASRQSVSARGRTLELEPYEYVWLEGG